MNSTFLLNTLEIIYSNGTMPTSHYNLLKDHFEWLAEIEKESKNLGGGWAIKQRNPEHPTIIRNNRLKGIEEFLDFYHFLDYF